MKRLSLVGLTLLVSGVVWGCGGADESDADQNEFDVIGAGGTGGSLGEGGAPGAGGTIGTRGSIGTGGSFGTGGSVGTGGSIGTGGSVGTGGTGGAGGSGQGGSPGTGGTGGEVCLPQTLTHVAGQVEVLLVIDDSSSMDQYQMLMQNDLDAFFLPLTGQFWQVGVTTTDMTNTGPQGRLVPLDGSSPRIVDRTVPDALDIVSENIFVGWQGSATEEGINAAIRAVTPPLIDSADDPNTIEPDDGNLGFLRPNSHLAIVFVTDEEDDSRLPVADAHHALLAAVGGDPALLSTHVIVIDKYDCSGQSRYADLAQLTGGRFEEVCTWDPTNVEMEAALANIGADIASRLPDAHWAGGTPVDVNGDGVVDEEDLVVLVGGVELPQSVDGTAQWTWDDAAQKLVFAPHAWPAAGVDVELANGCTP